MEKENKKRDPEKKTETKLELSEEAKITPEQEKHVKRLKDNRMVVSPEPKFESEEESGEEIEAPRRTDETAKNEESKTSDSMDKSSKTEEDKGISDRLESSDFTTSEFISLLASYEVPLEGTIKELITKIKERGEEHLKEELRELLSKNSGEKR